MTPANGSLGSVVTLYAVWRSNMPPPVIVSEMRGTRCCAGGNTSASKPTTAWACGVTVTAPRWRRRASARACGGSCGRVRCVRGFTLASTCCCCSLRIHERRTLRGDSVCVKLAGAGCSVGVSVHKAVRAETESPASPPDCVCEATLTPCAARGSGLRVVAATRASCATHGAAAAAVGGAWLLCGGSGEQVSFTGWSSGSRCAVPSVVLVAPATCVCLWLVPLVRSTSASFAAEPTPPPALSVRDSTFS